MKYSIAVLCCMLLPAFQANAAEEIAFSSPPLAARELGEIRGAFSPSEVSLNLLDAVSAHNRSDNSVTGSNTIDSDAFTNSHGLVNLIQNSGNNVIIQSATIVNLKMQ
jgi:hypothetical protein